MSRAGRLFAALVAGLMLALPALAGTREDVLATYQAFAEAQNARDPDRIGAFFIDGPEFLWVSDGQSFWGREATLARMGNFQKAAVWRVEPDLGAARVVELDAGVAMLHMPLVLEIGSKANPSHLRFLVSILFRKEDTVWRIAALLTTTEKRAAP